MSTDEKRSILQSIDKLKEPDKSLVIGFAAGIVAKSDVEEPLKEKQSKG